MIRYLWLHSQGQRGCIVIRLILGAVQVLLGLSVIWISKRFIDEAVRGGELLPLAVILFILIGITVIVRQSIGYLDMMVNARLTSSYRQQILSRIMQRSVFSCGDLHSVDLTSMLMQDIPTITKTICHIIPQATTTGIQLIGAFWLMHLLDPRLAWFLLLGTPVLAVLGKAFGIRLRKMTRGIREQEAMIQGKSQEWIENTITLQALRCLNTLAEIMADLQQSLVCQVEKRAKLTVFGRSVVSVCFGLSYMGVFVWGGYQLRNGAITFGMMTAFLQLVNQIQHPIMALMNTVPELFQTAASIDRLREVERFRLCKEVCRDSLLKQGEILLKDVCFKYPESDTYVIKGLSWHIHPGSKVCITGISGRGKTTLFRLILGLIETDGEQIRRGSCRIAYVPQGNTLISGTIRENLLLANPKACTDDLKETLWRANAEFGYSILDKRIDEKGGGLSEGMAQRIAIARGLLQPNDILLLDEVSSALDGETEREMCERIFTAYPEKTIIAISHNKAVWELFDERFEL